MDRSTTDLKSYTTGMFMSEISSLLGPELRNNLETKLDIYEKFGRNLAEDGVVIFTSKPEIWKTDELRPFIITNQPLPPVPPHYDPKIHDIARDVMDFFRKMSRKGEEYLYTSVTLFLLANNEVHILLSNNETIIKTEPIETYIKIPIPYPEPSFVSIRALVYSVQDAREYAIQDLYVGADSKREPRLQIARKVGIWLLSAELKKNLRTKVEKFAELTPYEEDTAVIFERASPGLIWPKELKFVLIEQSEFPLPLPLYGNDDYQENIISRYILEYVKQVAKELNCVPFYAAYHLEKFRFVGKWRYSGHLLFSQYKEPLRGVNACLTTEDPPAKSMVRMPMYSSESYTEWYTKISALVDVTDQEMLPAARDTGSRMGPTFDPLFSKRMRDDITKKLRLFCNDEEAKYGIPVMFVDAPEFWPRNLQYNVIPDNPLIPRSSHYLVDQRDDLVRDILNFARCMAKQMDCQPFYAACSKLGMDICFEAHLMFCRRRGPITLASRWGCSTSEDAPSALRKRDPNKYRTKAGRNTKRKLALDEDMKKNLDYKVKLFLSGAPYKKDTAVVFDHEKLFYWPTYLNIVVLEDPPPFYSLVDYEDFRDLDMARLILDYVNDRAREDFCVPFYASCSKEAFETDERIHLMFSNFKNPILATSTKSFTTEELLDPFGVRASILAIPPNAPNVAGPSTGEGQSVESPQEKKKSTLLEKFQHKLEKMKKKSDGRQEKKKSDK